MAGDFPASEYEARTATARDAMRVAGLDALFLTTDAEIRYFTGFRTLFWQSPTRPWFLILPAEGGPIAVIPSIGAALMAKTWVRDIRTWQSPHASDDGVSLLAEALGSYRTVGTPMGRESALRMPLTDFERLRAACPELVLRDATPLLRSLRMIKSAAEVETIAEICAIASRAFASAPRLFHVRQTREQAFRAFRIELLRQGADDVPYLVGGSGPDGYDDVISPPDDAPIAEGDVLMLDTGATRRGYFCDFDRNFAFGHASAAVRRGYATLVAAIDAGLAAVRPGAEAADLFRAMACVIEAAGYPMGEVGRLGHGLGMQLTEPPSLVPFDRTVLAPGMVLTLEPGLTLPSGRTLVLEENLVVGPDGARLLTERAPPELPVL